MVHGTATEPGLGETCQMRPEESMAIDLLFTKEGIGGNLCFSHGYCDMQRWTKGKLDHEASSDIQLEELEQMARVFEVACRRAPSDARFAEKKASAEAARSASQAAVEALRKAEADFKAGTIGEKERDWRIHGWGQPPRAGGAGLTLGRMQICFIFLLTRDPRCVA